MASLTAHLRRPDDHARLGFHPECPICRRERLSGALPPDAIISRRSQALLAAGVLALSSAAPTVTLAAEPDQEQEGTTAPEQVATDHGPSAPDLDPGGQPTELPLDAGPAPETDAAPDPTGEPTPLEQEPAANDEVPAADAEDATSTQNAGEQPEPPASDPLPPPPASESAAPPPPSVPASSAPADQAPVATRGEPQVDGAPSPREHELESAGAPPPAPEHGNAGEPRPRSRAIVPARTNRATPAVQPDPIDVATASASTTSQAAQGDSVTASRRQAARRADRFHVVQRGESLWSIATDLLGDDASVARVAREVNRLWELNSARIGTGEPDLLLAGTRIALR